MSDAHLIETRVDGQPLVDGDFLHVVRDRVRLPDGSLTQREYVVHPGAVVVVPLVLGVDGRTRVVLERQYRHPVRQVVIEFPAGKRDAGEGALQCGQRELLEETGYRAAQWARAGRLHPVVAYSTEVIELWFARGLTPGERKLDAGEFLDVFTADAAEFLEWCRDGRVTDAKTLVGALWLQNVLAGTWTLDWQPTGSPHASEGGAAGVHGS